MKSLVTSLFLIIGLFANNCDQAHRTVLDTTWCTSAKMAGITMVAPPQAFENNPMPNITKVHANWVAFIPYGYSRMDNAAVGYNSAWQWWGEKIDGIKESIRLAQQADLNILLKPQVYVPGGWIGSLDYATDEEWQAWEQDYREYIMDYVHIAEEMQVEMLCIGTEIKVSVKKRPQFWAALIAEIRSKYSGKLTYSANWDSYQDVPFWQDLDYIGVSAYFPLTDDKLPTVGDLTDQWEPYLQQLKAFAEKQKTQILFTEYGYQSVDGCAGKAWEIEKDHSNRNINEEAQANAIKALIDTFEQEKWWSGGFLWKWFPNMKGHEGYPAKDYTPQGKIAEQTLSDCYKKMNLRHNTVSDSLNITTPK